MGQIAREALSGFGMTLTAGLENVGGTYVTAGIRHRENIMCSMAVVTLGGLQVPQLGNLTMVGVKIGRRDFLVTLATLIHDLQSEPFVIGTADTMGSVAVVAHWCLALVGGIVLRMYALIELLFDSVVAPAASLGNIFPVNAGFGI